MHKRICEVCSKEFTVKVKSSPTRTCGMACGHVLLKYTPEKALEVMWSRIDRSGSCWIWKAGTNNRGYGAMNFCGTVVAVHRLMYQLAHGNIDPALFVLHRCDTPRCVNPAHLYLGDNEQNMKDCSERGRRPINRAKLTPEQVEDVRARFRRTAPMKSNAGALAKEYGVGVSAIYAIIHGRSWNGKTTWATLASRNIGKRVDP